MSGDTKIDLGDMTPIVQKAILDSLTEGTRAMLIEKAVLSLITPDRDRFGVTPEPPIQAMFRSALWSCAEQVVKQIIADSPEYQEQVARIVQGFLVTLDRETYDNTMMEVVTQAIISHFREQAKR
jgi:isocitrate dehydrogenase kinase/phosphatase